MDTSYRSWLQSIANGSGLPAQEAGALLQVVGDDGRMNDHFASNPYGYTGTDRGQIQSGGEFYGPEGTSRINNQYLTKFNARNPATPLHNSSGVQGASTWNSGGSGGYSAPAYDTSADRAYLDDQEARLRRQHGSIDTTERSGLTQLGDSYNKEVSGANAKQGRFLSDVGLQREDTTRGKDAAIGKVNTNARTLADSVRRRIGMASGSGSSAYQQAAPRAVSRLASGERTNVLENFGTNFRNLDIRENRGKEDFASMLEDIAAQRKSRESDFRSGLLDRRNQVDNSLSEVARQRALLGGGGYQQVKSAMAPFASSIDSRQSEIDSLFDRFRTPYAQKPVDVSMPNLRDYTVDRAAINANNSRGQDPNSPYGQFLRKDDEEERLV